MAGEAGKEAHNDNQPEDTAENKAVVNGGDIDHGEVTVSPETRDEKLVFPNHDCEERED